MWCDEYLRQDRPKRKYDDGNAQEWDLLGIHGSSKHSKASLFIHPKDELAEGACC